MLGGEHINILHSQMVGASEKLQRPWLLASTKCPFAELFCFPEAKDIIDI